MTFRLLLILLLAALVFPKTSSQVIISEFMASNTRTFADEDGEYSDWIELYNPSDSDVDLDGWSLTDSAINLRKWRFPAVHIGRGQTLLVFASNKDRHLPGAPLHTNFKMSSGDYLGLVDASGKVVFDFGPTLGEQVPDVSFGVVVEKKEIVLLATNAPARFTVPTDGSADAIWKLTEFDDSKWSNGTNALGFDAGNIGYAPIIRTDVSGQMLGANSTAYIRLPFLPPDAELNSLTLRVHYDDGFTAFLNGVLVAQANAPSDLAWNSAATAQHSAPDALLAEEIDLSDQIGLLHDGQNVLAIQSLNSSKDDPGLLTTAELVATYSVVQTNVWRYFFQPTPNAINGLGDTNLGPLILNASLTPALPNQGDSIVVTAKMQQTFNPPSTLNLNYLVMFGAETNVAMLDDGLHGDGTAGDGIYGAILNSGATNGQMVRWYFRATDEQGLITRWPPYRETKNSPQYFGTVISDPSLTNRLPVLQWFVKSTSGADNTSGTRCSVFWDGVLYDNVFVNLHGQSSAGFPKKSYNLNFNTGYHFRYSKTSNPIGKVNLLTTYPDKAHVRNILAYEVFRDAGHGYHFVIPIRVQRNAAFFADAHMVEDGDADYLRRNGLDGNGALYKMYNTLDSSTSGVEKKTRTFEKNADLQALIRGLTSGTNRPAYFWDNVNIPGMVNYLASLTMTANVDCCHKNYYLYRDSMGSGEWQMLPWDMDLSFGRNWTGDYFDDRMYPQNDLNPGSNNTLVQACYNNADFKLMYARRMRTLMDEQLQPPGTPLADLKWERRLDELFEIIGPDAALDYVKWPTWGKKQTMSQALDLLRTNYLGQRRTFLYVTKKSSIPAAITNQPAISFSTLDFNPESGWQNQEYISITNSDNVAVDLSGWQIGGAINHRFAPGTVLPAKRVLYLSPDVTAFRKRTSGPSGGQRLFVQGNYHGQLSARGEALTLRDRQGALIQTFSYIGQPTLAQQVLRVSEIMYAPAEPAVPGYTREDLEYIVLKNIGGAALNLNGVHFTNGISFTFTNDIVLPASSRLYLARNPAAFTGFYGYSALVTGPYIGQLSNSGETIQLDDAVGEKIVSFSYDNKWYASANGGGYSLVLANDETGFDNLDQKSSWIPSFIPGGSAALGQSWASWRSSYFNAKQLNDLLISGPDADPDRDGISNYGEFIAGTHPLMFSSKFSILSAPNLTLAFQEAPGRRYSVSRATSLSGIWTRIRTFPRSTQSDVIKVPLEKAGADQAAFYRVEVEF